MNPPGAMDDHLSVVDSCGFGLHRSTCFRLGGWLPGFAAVRAGLVFLSGDVARASRRLNMYLVWKIQAEQ